MLQLQKIVIEYDQTNQATDYSNKIMKDTLNDRSIFCIYFRLKYHIVDFLSCFRSGILRRSHPTGRLNVSIPTY